MAWTKQGHKRIGEITATPDKCDTFMCNTWSVTGTKNTVNTCTNVIDWCFQRSGNHVLTYNLAESICSLFTEDFTSYATQLDADTVWGITGTNMRVNISTDVLDWDGKRDCSNHGTSFDLRTIIPPECNSGDSNDPIRTS